jgi:hypothetical protein
MQEGLFRTDGNYHEAEDHGCYLGSDFAGRRDGKRGGSGFEAVVTEGAGARGTR